MQTINRHNYEEYFLLYADDELDAATKFAVENFVQQNTDLAVELEMLIQTKLKAENILFDDKETLLRTEGNSVNETNYEEHFLLYIDDELSPVKRSEVEKYILQHPVLQNEFTTLKQAVLPVESVSYGSKEDLYKTEKRRAFYFKSWYLAAAAIFIGVCAVSIWLMYKPEKVNVVAENIIHQHQTNNNDHRLKENAVIEKIADSIKQTQPLAGQAEVVEQQSASIKKTKSNKAAVKNNDVKMPKTEHADIAENASIQINEALKNTTDNTIIQQDDEPASNKNDVAVETLPSNNNKKTIIDVPQNNLTNTAEENSNGYKLYNVAYKEINPNDDNNSLHIGAFDLNKNKVKTLLKKAGRLFSKKQNKAGDVDGKLQIASFKINTINQ